MSGFIDVYTGKEEFNPKNPDQGEDYFEKNFVKIVKKVKTTRKTDTIIENIENSIFGKTINFSNVNHIFLNHSNQRNFLINKSTDDDGNEQLNNYVISTNILGKGTYGLVKLCHNIAENKDYAIKIIDKAKLKRMFFTTQKKFVNPIENEITILNRLNSIHIVKTYEIIDAIDHNNTYIILEYMKKGSISKILQQKKFLNILTIWNYFRNLILGLEYLHEKVKIIHFDIKPDNLLVNEFNKLKITDFGISYQFYDVDLVKSNNLGSPFYMAPEMTYKDAKYFGKPCDIWSSGVTLFYIIFKRLPFYVKENHEIKKLFEKIRQEE